MWVSSKYLREKKRRSQDAVSHYLNFCWNWVLKPKNNKEISSTVKVIREHFDSVLFSMDWILTEDFLPFSEKSKMFCQLVICS